MLGRPTVIRSDAADVIVPAPINADGTRNFFNVYQRHFIQLLHLAGETVEKVRKILVDVLTYVQLFRAVLWYWFSDFCGRS